MLKDCSHQRKRRHNSLTLERNNEWSLQSNILKLVLHQFNIISYPTWRHRPTTASVHHLNTFSLTIWWREPSFPAVPPSSALSKSTSMSDLSLPLVLPSEPVEVVEDVESLPETFGFASGTELLMQHII